MDAAAVGRRQVKKDAREVFWKRCSIVIRLKLYFVYLQIKRCLPFTESFTTASFILNVYHISSGNLQEKQWHLPPDKQWQVASSQISSGTSGKVLKIGFVECC